MFFQYRNLQNCNLDIMEIDTTSNAFSNATLLLVQYPFICCDFKPGNDCPRRYLYGTNIQVVNLNLVHSYLQYCF